MLRKIIIFFLLTSLVLANSCIKFKKTDARKIPTDGVERAKVNIKEGKGISVKNARDSLKNRGGGSYEFSSSNPMWRASLEILDFIPLTTVDYSGGMIITDWYSDNPSNNDSIKISIRFLSNEISATNLKISVFQKNCDKANNCSTALSKSKIEDELLKSILQKASLIKKATKK
jgi:hypothetical protein